MPLVTAQQLDGLRFIAELGMETTVDIYPRVESEAPSDTVDSWPTKSLSTKGWLRSMPAMAFNIDVGVLEASTPFRLFLPVGTPVKPGDRVKIAGADYSVVDTNVESTLQVVLRCTLRKVGT
jgi:hypothetical protein